MKAAYLAQVRKDLLEKATGLVPTHGFSNVSLFPLALSAIQETDAYKERINTADIDFVNLFPRGFPIALVEYIVESTNKAVHIRLEERFNKNVIINSIARNGENCRAAQYSPPGVKNVVEEAILTKINALVPYVSHWPEAVALEWKPSNAPFAVKNLAEFVDTTCYYAERMENLGAVIASGNLLLKSRLGYSTHHFPQRSEKKDGEYQQETDEERFWRRFVSSIPLSTGPHMGEGLLSYEWYMKRTKVATVFSLAMFSFLGEEKGQYRDTRAMLNCITDRLF
ncbi:putative dynein heavy chain [Trypanosoma rangeli]|uniref:Ubiquinone biosynthesis protein n=1 Tax=Trypanosoma rangeli TaxID=5698 RepID=A0A422MQP2_TRYRA|nr:putative dynein heavy chain [Trypanosoma rangeli]RNE95526.1 putative dynein heavy chain [Trypanosoma rangeli]|eukprot:RNE95526.1 putative dynein heavy chain [Trypanosoma rangeli]